MPGKRVQFDDETWHALNLLARDRMQDFQELADEAFRDFAAEARAAQGLKTALRQSAGVDPVAASSVAPLHVFAARLRPFAKPRNDAPATILGLAWCVDGVSASMLSAGAPTNDPGWGLPALEHRRSA